MNYEEVKTTTPLETPFMETQPKDNQMKENGPRIASG